MRKTFLFFWMTFLMSWGSLSAQRDYVFMLDNGGSMDQEEYHTMRRGAIKLMEQLLACNSDNRVAIVQYGTGILDEDTGVYKPLIYIESDFTNDFFTAQNFNRRLDFGDYLQQSVGLVRDAMMGVSNPDIISPQKTLNREQETRFIIFTDAERASDGLSSYIVDPVYAPNSYGAFAAVMDFKMNVAVGETIRFTVIHANTNDDAIQAGASVASGDGLYTGPYEVVPQDPGNGYPRSYYNRTNGFHILPGETNYWKDLAASICNSNGRGTMDFIYEPGSCIYGTSILKGNYHLEAGVTLQDLKLELINIETGAIYPVYTSPPVLGGNSFYFNFTPGSFAAALSAGSTGHHKFRLTMISNSPNGSVAYSWNKYPFFDYDIDLDCPAPTFARSSSEEKIFKLTPNPNNGLFKVIMNKEVKLGTLEIRDLVGNTVYNKILRGEKEIEINLSSRKEGVYLVNITTDKNEIYSEKIIKK
ncbi:T9SS type A sorting domain-containing protein [Chryseobacterium sp.]|uniref:T9SS type A sorting domain-containing protein n=1 Tax=Chryseobacterium sp. TaxID=1871047 RepID=UPI00321A66C0